MGGVFYSVVANRRQPWRGGGFVVHYFKSAGLPLHTELSVEVQQITPWTIRYVIKFHTFHSNICTVTRQCILKASTYALEGAIHIARSISFVAVAAICIDKPNIFLTSPRWSMSDAIHIAVCNIATMCLSMHITPINMIVFNTFNTYCIA